MKENPVPNLDDGGTKGKEIIIAFARLCLADKGVLVYF